MNELNGTQAGLKTGQENLIHNGQKLDQTLLDFWSWNSSDLLSNATY